MLVEIVGGSYSIEDGLVNGTEVIFKHYSHTAPDIIWIEFVDQKVGAFA